MMTYATASSFRSEVMAAPASRQSQSSWASVCGQGEGRWMRSVSRGWCADVDMDVGRQ